MNTHNTIELVLEPEGQQNYGLLPSDLGKGYDSLKRETTFQAFKSFTKESSGGPNQAEYLVEYDYKKIRSKFGMKSTLNVETSVTTVDVSVDVTDVLETEDTTVYVFWYQRIITEQVAITNFVLSDRVADYITHQADNRTIYENLGNKVITEISNGGEIMLIAKFSSRSKEESIKIKAILDVNTNIFMSDVDLHLQLDRLHREVNQSMTFQVTAKSLGGTINLDQLTNPATIQKGIEEWTTSMKNNPATLEFECSDLKILGNGFTRVSEWVDRNQEVSDEINTMLINIVDSKTLAGQYQTLRRNLKLPTLASVNDLIDRCQTLRGKLTEERNRLQDTAATALFTLAEAVRVEYNNIRKKTPVFGYQDLGKSDSCGYIGSGMPPFGDEMEHAKYFASMDVITDVGLQGFTVSFDRFDSPERVNRSYAQGVGNHTRIDLDNELLVSMQGWDMPDREGYPSVKSVQFTGIKGTSYGPPAPSPNPTTTLNGSAMEGAEKYIIGIWGSGNTWTQRVGPYFRACSTDYPYENE